MCYDSWCSTDGGGGGGQVCAMIVGNVLVVVEDLGYFVVYWYWLWS